MANKKTDKMYRVSPRENGKYYAIESSYDGGKTWHSTGDSSPSQEEANKKIENMKKGLTASGLTQEEAKASIPEGTPTIGNADPNSKTVLTKEEAAKAGINWRTLPTQYELEHPIITGNKKNDSNGWVDSDGNVHLNSKATEARNNAAIEDRKNNRDYRTAKAPSQRELDMRNGNFNTKNVDGTYAWSNEELISTRETARKNKDTELEDAVQKEINRRKLAEARKADAEKYGEEYHEDDED